MQGEATRISVMKNKVAVVNTCSATKDRYTKESRIESEERLRLAFESVTEGITVTDLTGNIIQVNDAAVRLYSCTGKLELIGRSVFELMAERDHTRATESLKRTLDEGYIREVECTFVTRNGKEFPGKFRTALLKNMRGNPEGFIIIAEDVTKLKQAEARILVYRRKLRSLAYDLSLVEEHERRRIAMEIHDHLSQDLAICRIKLGALLKSVNSHHTVEELVEINNIIRHISDKVRSLTFKLDSPLLHEFGLEAAVERMTEQMQKQHGIHFGFKDDGKPKQLADDVRTILFQIVRELLINVVKHARAHNVTVCTKRHKGNIQITVDDDGIGFDMHKTAPAKNRTDGFGLFIICQRLDSIGGQLQFESERGRGTRVTILAPISEKRT